MKRRRTRLRKPPKRRNVVAVVARRLGHRVRPSAKSYRRSPKHKNPRPGDGDFGFAVPIRLASQSAFVLT